MKVLKWLASLPVIGFKKKTVNENVRPEVLKVKPRRRARDAKGRYIADDPSTAANEAYEAYNEAFKEK
tara:strand:+ start:11756 stop:11959 length:204 start_codon:yes stop_codon:yes gene_type:complete